MTLEQQYDELSSKISYLQTERAKVADKIAKQNSPFKIGDIIENPLSLTKAKVEDIVACQLHNWRYKLIIRKIKRDGTMYAGTNELLDPRRWRKKL
jgi:hypothetical protein